MDVIELLLVVASLSAIGVSAVHVYDRFHPRGFYQRTIGIAERNTALVVAKLGEVGPAVGSEVEGALERVAEAQERKYQEAAASAEKAVQGTLKGAEMSMVRAVGVDKQMRRTVDHALSEAILGPALPILRQFAPGLADSLEENPQLVDVLLEHPLFLKYVEPRIRQFLGKQPSGHLSVDSSGWGT